MKESNDDASIKSVNIKRLRIMVKYIGKRIVFNAISIDMKFLGQSKENAMVGILKKKKKHMDTLR